MSKHRVAVLKVVAQQLSVTTAAAECGMSRGHLHRLLRRYREQVRPRTLERAAGRGAVERSATL